MTPESTRKAFAELHAALHDARRVFVEEAAKALNLRQILDWITTRLDRLSK